MNKLEAEALVKKYSAGTATPEERALLERWYLMEGSQTVFSDSEEDLTALKEELWQGTLERAGLERRLAVQRPLWRRYAVAASILAVLSFGTYWFVHRADTVQSLALAVIKPGGNKAVLTLGNGQQIVLNDAKKGVLASQGNVAIQKTGDGALAYAGSASTEFNTMSTPKGGQYTVVLADGTKVTLNASSSLRYPAAFAGRERRVELTGEAYFEVAHNKARPFRVVSNGQTVEVLGTHFDVNAYADEPVVRTTLLEGSVRVRHAQAERVIRPGEEAVLAQGALAVQAADVERATAWVHGDFDFAGTQLGVIMRQVSRWYDVEVLYQGNMEHTDFGGSISRAKNIQDVLKVLEMTNGCILRSREGG